MEHGRYNAAINNWLNRRAMVLEEDFVTALHAYAKRHQMNNGIKRLDEVYNMIGTRKAYISYWKKRPWSTQTKNF